MARRRNTPKPTTFLSPQELAEYLNVSVSMVYDMRKRHEGPPGHRVGGLVRYRLSDVDAWLEENSDQKRAR